MTSLDTAERMIMMKGLLRGIEECLDVKFGDEGLERMPERRQIRDPGRSDDPSPHPVRSRRRLAGRFPSITGPSTCAATCAARA
jgi:hypothetical protein